MRKFDGIKAWIGDKEGAVRGVLGFVTGRDRHHGGIGCRIDIEVRDKFGNLVSHREVVSKSFNKSFYNNVAALYAGAPDAVPSINILATDNVAYNRDLSTLTDIGDWVFESGAGVDLYGVLVGTSATAWSFTGYQLQAKIANGGGAGQLAYGACSTSVAVDSGVPAKVTLQRSFDNNSGAEITVREIGWFGKMKTDVATFKYHMIARDVITATAIPNGGRLTVKYTILINPA